MSQQRRIVVPVDFSEHSRAAAERALYFAELCDARVHLLHAHALPPTTLDPSVTPALRDEIRQADKAAFDALVKEFTERGHEITTSFVDRDPADAIHSAALEDGCELIVMGSHGRRGFDRLLLGSVAERVLQGSPVPIQIVRETVEEASQPIRSILLATDFSKDAERAEQLVATWAPRLGAEVEVIHAIRETAVLFAPYAVAGSSDFEGEMMEAAEARIERVVDRLASAGISAKTKIVYGRAAESILDRAESTNTQIVVMGTRGYSTFQRFLLGSTAHRVLRHAPCSVLVASAESRIRNV